VDGAARLGEGPIRARSEDPVRAIRCAAALTTTLILEGAFGLSHVLGWRIGINAFTLSFYAIDKLKSQSTAAQAVRVPEFALLAQALLCGIPAAFLAMLVLRHKVSQSSFLLWVVLVVVAQGAALSFFRDSIPSLARWRGSHVS
jgi:uncharacterized membrane protein YsdA (DUF1294 family)